MLSSLSNYQNLIIFPSSALLQINSLFSLFFTSPDANSPQVVKKPPVNSSEEWSVKRPSDDTVSIISSLHSSPTVSPQGSPRKGVLFTLYAFIHGMLHQMKRRPRVDLVKHSSPSRATEKMLLSYLEMCL